jgi:electron transport complex protein RnfG
MPEGDFFKKKDDPFIYHEVYKKDNLVGYCFSTRKILPDTEGFGGSIDILVGIDISGNIENVRILEHHETPEYAGGITESAFLDQFRGKRPEDNFKVGDDIDAVTHATVSSQAVGAILKSGMLKMNSVVGLEADTPERIDAVSGSIIDRLRRAGLKPREAEYYSVIDE